MRRWNECNSEILCDECTNQGNENKVFEAKLIFLKRQASFNFGHMLPNFEE